MSSLTSDLVSLPGDAPGSDAAAGGDAAGGDARGDEFPAGAAEAPDDLSRRTMLSIMGASFALAGLEGCRRPLETIVPYVSGPEMVVPGVPRRYATTVPFGTSAYGVVVESHEGRPTKIEGNELHPASGGAASTWMQAAVLNLYDPDRSRQVLRRGGAEEGDAEASDATAASWEDFVAFLGELRGELEASGGAGLAVLSGAYASPSLARAAAELAQRFPQARWVVHEPLDDGNLLRGCETAAGSACRPVYDLTEARTIVALDCDFLAADADSLATARGFAQSRKVAGPDGEMSRLYAVESSMTTTGAAADHRLRLRRGLVPAFAAALARQLGLSVEGPGAEALPEAARGKVRVIAEDLRASGEHSALLVGRSQPPAVHALAVAIHAALGALGKTVTLHELRDTTCADAEAFAALAEDMRGGGVRTLVMLGGNPAYTAPADVDFAGALAAVEHSIHLSSHVDETSQLAGWHLPEAHFLEAWGDARAADGTASVVQPLIAPLYGGRSALELVGLLADGEPRSGHEMVRRTWAEQLGGGDGWRKALHDGLLEGSATPAVTPQASAPGPVSAAADDGMELTFEASRSAFDGRFANNSWLQELPDAITKITWDNAALVSPKTAAELGLSSGDIATLSLGERSLEAPVFVLPGQADGSVALALGYGRSAAGRVGDGVGVNAYTLRVTGALHAASGLQVAKAAGSHALVQTQEHQSMEGRHLVLEASLEEYREHPGFVSEELHQLEDTQLYDYHRYEEGYQWGMAIDLSACTGCNACIVACQSENNIPVVGKEQVDRGREMHWLRVDRYFAGAAGDEALDDPEVVFQPVPCMHCENAPCEEVCPVVATVHDSEGVNAMVYNRCIGTRYCSNNCPYKVRRFNFFNYTKDTPELMKMAMNPDVTVRSRGVMEKCSYCLQRLSEGKIAAKKDSREVADGEIRTACQQTCPADAIAFGNLRDPESAVSKQKQRELNYTVLDELNNRPRTSFLAKLRNPNPAWETA